MFDQPPGELRAAPPHAIRADGVGPYLLGSSLRSVLGLVRFGPRVSLLELEGVADYSVVRAESDALLIGVRRAGGVTFVAVVQPEIARTEGQVAVGSSLDDAISVLGERLDPARWAASPDLQAFASLPGGRFVIADGKIAAVLVREPVTLREPVSGGVSRCEVVARTEDVRPSEHDAGGAPHGSALRDVATREIEKLVGRQAESLSWLCSGHEIVGAVISVANEFVVAVGSAGKWSVLTRQKRQLGGFVAPLDVDGDGIDELVLVEHRRTLDAYGVSLAVAAIDSGRLQVLGEFRPYEISRQRAEWIGAALSDVELLIEVAAVTDGVSVSGVLLQRSGGTFRTVAPLDESRFAVKRGKPTPTPTPASHPAPAADAGVGVGAPTTPVNRLAPPPRTPGKPSPRPADAGPRSKGPGQP